MNLTEFEKDAMRQLTDVADLATGAAVTVGREGDALRLVRIRYSYDHDHKVYGGNCWENPMVFTCEIIDGDAPGQVRAVLEEGAWPSAAEAARAALDFAGKVNRAVASLVRSVNPETVATAS